MPNTNTLPDYDPIEAQRQVVEEHSIYVPDLERRLTTIKGAIDTLYAVAASEDPQQEELDFIADTLRENYHAIYLALDMCAGEPPVNIFNLRCPTLYRAEPKLEDVVKPANGGDNG